MAREPGLSVRTKLTLSYAGFLMVAGALLLVVVWVSLLRYIPDNVIFGLPWIRPWRSDPLNGFSLPAVLSLAFLLVFGLVGGWLLAGRMLAPLNRITDAARRAGTGSLAHRIELPGREDEFRELADAFDAMLARLEAHVAEQQRFAANASHELRTPLAITQTLLDVARSDRTRDPAELVDRLYAVNTRAIDLTEALLLLTRADQRSFAREPVDLSLIAEEATESLLPFAEEHGLTIETSGEETRTVGSPTLLLQLCTNLLHNAIVHNLPAGGTVWVTTNVARRVRGADGREHRRAAHTRAGRHARRAVPARQRAHPHRSRRCRARPGDRQEHHRGPRRDAHPHPARRGGDCASPCSYPRSSPDRSPRSSTDTRNAKLSSRSRSKPKPLPTSSETKPCRAERTTRAAWVAASSSSA